MSMGCGFDGDLLADRAAGRLDPRRAREVDAHVATCGECRRSIEVIHAVRASTIQVPEGLEARIQEAVRSAAGADALPESDSPAVGHEPRSPHSLRRRFGWSRSRAWALPVAAAAALAVLWLGLGQDRALTPGDGGGVEAAVEAMEAAEYEPYGAWPASDGVVAGDLVLSDLSVEELELLLEELES